MAVFQDFDKNIFLFPFFLIFGVAIYFYCFSASAFCKLLLVLLIYIVFSVKDIDFKKLDKKCLFLALALFLFFILGVLIAHIRVINVRHYTIDRNLFYKELECSIEDISSSYNNNRFLVKLKIKNNEALLFMKFKNKKAENLNIGDLIRVTNVFLTPIAMSHPNIARKMFFEKISGTGYCSGEIKWISCGADSFKKRVFCLKKNFIRNLVDRVGIDKSFIVSSMILGGRQNSGIEESTLRSIRQSGLSHLLAISGIHFYVIHSLIFTFLNFIFLNIFFITRANFIHSYSYYISLLCTSAFSMLYLNVIGFAISANRTFLMTFFHCLSSLLFRQSSARFRLVSAAILLVIFSPEIVFAPGFQMSFLSVASLIYSDKLTSKYSQSHYFIVKIVKSLFLQSFVVSIAISPCCIYHFNSLPIAGVISNIIAIPIVSYIILPFAIFSSIIADSTLSNIIFKILNISLDLLLLIARKFGTSDYCIQIALGEYSICVLYCLAIIFFYKERIFVKLIALISIALILVLGHISHMKNNCFDLYLYISNNNVVNLMGRGIDGSLYDLYGRRLNFFKRTWLRENLQNTYLAVDRGKIERVKNGDNTIVLFKIKGCDMRLEIKKYPSSRIIKSICINDKININVAKMKKYGAYKIKIIDCDSYIIKRDLDSRQFCWMNRK